ncbi:right-handed parallel beta-helix repeat-containing protein, partial [bacterium]|nr:right-handed parallel beta-helix repeat-containing protein [bacterium]
MKKQLALIWAVLSFIILAGCHNQQNCQKAHFFVSSEGSDSFSGKFAEVTGDDGPFKTLQRAKEAVRELKKTVDHDIVVMLRGGHYYLDETVVFGLEDSGKDGQSIIYQNYPGEKPIITTGTPISGLRKCEGLPDEISDA